MVYVPLHERRLYPLNDHRFVEDARIVGVSTDLIRNAVVFQAVTKRNCQFCFVK